MSRFGRRTFLASSAGVAGAAAAGAPLPLGSTLGSVAAPRPGVLDAAGLSGGPIRALGLTVNGLTDPVGIDPDGCSFAWTLHSPGRAVAQAAFRVVVRRTDPTRAGLVWDSGAVASARQAFVAYGGPVLAADAAYQWTVQARDPAGWGPVAAPAQFTTALRDADWQAQWLRPAGDVVAARSRDIPAHRCHAARRRRRARHRLRVRRPHLPAVRGRNAGGRLAELLLPRRAVRAYRGPDRDGDRWATQRRRRAASLVRAWSGTPGLVARPALPALRLVHATAATPSSDRTAPGVSARPNGCRPRSATADVGDFVEWVDGRAQPQGWSSPGYDDGTWSAVTVLGPAGSAPFSRDLRAADHHPRDAGSSGPAAHGGGRRCRGRLRGRVCAQGRRWPSPGGSRGRTVTIRAGYLLDPDGQVSTLHGTQETNLSSSYIMRAGGQAFEAFTYFGFRYLQIDERWPAARCRRHRGPDPARRHARRPHRHVLVGRPHAQRGVAAHGPLVPLLLQRAVRRHADPGEGSLPLGRQRTSPKASCAPTATRT